MVSGIVKKEKVEGGDPLTPASSTESPEVTQGTEMGKIISHSRFLAERCLKEFTYIAETVGIHRPYLERVFEITENIKLSKEEINELKEEYKNIIALSEKGQSEGDSEISPEFSENLHELLKSIRLLEKTLLAPGGRYALVKLRQSLISERELEEIHEEDGIIVFTDITGFTKLATQLKGNEIRLQSILNSCFSTLGGQIIGEARKPTEGPMSLWGDAFLVLFHGHDAEERAKKACDKMLRAMNEFADLDISIGIASGKVNLGILGNDKKESSRRMVILGGDALKNAYKAEKEAAPDDYKIWPTPQKEKIEPDKEIIKREKDYKFTLPKELEQIIQKMKNVHGAKKITNIINQLSAVLMTLSPSEYIDYVHKALTTKNIEHAEYTHRTVAFIDSEYIDYSTPEGERFLGELSSIVGLYKGSVNKLGLITFEPLSEHKGDSELRAYLCMQALLEKFPDLKIGINSGKTFWGLFGIDGQCEEITGVADIINLAARLMQNAKKGEILVSKNFHELIKDTIKKYESRKGEFKNIEGEVEYCSLKGVNKKFGINIENFINSASPVIFGRDAELEKLEEAYQSENKMDHYSVTGSPGVGKTTLLQHFLKDKIVYGVRAKPQTCQRDYYVWAEATRSILNLNPDDDLKKQKIVARQSLGSLGVAHRSEALMALIGLGELKLNEELIKESMKEFLEKLSKSNKEKIILFFEDMHWSDPGSKRVWEYVLRNIGKEDEKGSKGKGILLLGASRNKSSDDGSTIALGGLKGEAIDNLIFFTQHGRVAKEDELESISEELREFVIKNTQGNPSWIQEVVRLLIESDYLAPDEQGLKNVLPLNKLNLQEGVGQIIEGSINSLKAQGIFKKNTSIVLNILSILGERAPKEILQKMCNNHEINENELNTHLTILSQNDFIELEEENIDSIVFKHSAVKDTVYTSISLKQALHEEAIGLLKNLDTKNEDEYIEELIFEHATKAKIHNDIYEYGKKLAENFKEKPGMQRTTIYYAEQALEAANKLDIKDFSQKRELLMMIAGQQKAFDTKQAIASLDLCLKTSEKMSKGSEELYKQLEILQLKDEAIATFDTRDYRPFKNIFEAQSKILTKLIIDTDEEYAGRYEINLFKAKRSEITAQLYEGCQLIANNQKEAGGEILKKAQKNLNHILRDDHYDALKNEPELQAWFYYFEARVLLELGEKNEKVLNSTKKALQIYKNNPDKFKSLHLPLNIYNRTGLAHAASGQKKEAEKMYVQGVKLANKYGEVETECLILGNKADLYFNNNDWENCIKCASIGYQKSKEHQLFMHLVLATTNISYSYMKIGEKKANSNVKQKHLSNGTRYYNEFCQLIHDVPEDSRFKAELIKIKAEMDLWYAK